MRVAAVDIGTNSTRLLVADSTEGRLIPVFRTTTITRLGEGVDSRRHIDEVAMERTCAVLAHYSERIRLLRADRVGVIATSACRDADNRDDFFARVHKTVGATPKLLSGESEATLSFAGAVSAWTSPDSEPLLVVDIGGGSTELSVGVLDSVAVDNTSPPAEPRRNATEDGPDRLPPTTSGENGEIELPGVHLSGWTSLDIGCVRLTERFIHSDPPTAEELSEAIREVDSNLVTAERIVPVGQARTFIGLAGTVTSLAAMDLGLESYDPDAVHHHRISRKAVEKLYRYIVSSTREELRSDPGLEPMRADVIAGGAIVLVAIMRRWNFPEVVVSEADILDGTALATSLGLIGADAN